MLYLKTVSDFDNFVAVTPIGNSYMLHLPGSDYFEHVAEEDGDMTHLSHVGVLSFDDPSSSDWRGNINLSRHKKHYIIHENGNTFQKLG